ncbi:MAG: polysaccharide deacetylase family protein [Bacteroidetes bacterium]|nr:polysaccharide deacetylase family protein [Bacteroidota bacterium]
MHLKIGIMGRQDGWKLLLQQIGIPGVAVTNTLLPEEFSAVAASDDINDRESEMLRQYLALGGALLCSTKVHARIRQKTVQSVNVDYFYPPESSIFRSVGIIDIHAKCKLAWNANDLKTNRGNLGAYIGSNSKDIVIALPFNPASLVFDRRSAVKSFYSPEHRMPFETVSLVSKGKIRRLVSICLEFLHHKRGLPYVHLWHIPGGAKSVFCFRIDTDYGTDRQIEELSSVVHRNGIPAAWFIDVKSQENSLKLFKDMHKQELGIHCYEHQVFPDYERNIQNIKKAQSILHSTKKDAKGFAAPYGFWNEGLGRAIAECGFEYSSEFSYDYDNVPVVSRLGNTEGTLQIPVHPICIGSLKRHSYSDAGMIGYFDEVIRQKLAVREPIILYHHPRDGCHEVLDWIFNKIQQKRVPVKTMSEFARWWKMRTASIPEFRYSRGNVYARGILRDKSLYVHITKPDMTETIMPVSKQIIMKSVHWSRIPELWNVPDDFLRERHLNYRIYLIRSLDAFADYFRRKKQ